jgi:hypothetical protein
MYPFYIKTETYQMLRVWCVQITFVIATFFSNKRYFEVLLLLLLLSNDEEIITGILLLQRCIF